MDTGVRDQNTSYIPGKTRSENEARTCDQNEIPNSFVQACYTLKPTYGKNLVCRANVYPASSVKNSTSPTHLLIQNISDCYVGVKCLGSVWMWCDSRHACFGYCIFTLCFFLWCSFR